MDKKDLRPSAMTIVCYVLAVVLLLISFFNAINSYQEAMKLFAEKGLKANDSGVFTTVLGYVVNQSLISFSLGILFYCVGAVNQRICIQHKEVLYRLSLMDVRKNKK